MQDLVNMIALVCAAIAALGLGVTLAFAICRAAFALLQVQTRPVEPATVQSKAQAAEV